MGYSILIVLAVVLLPLLIVFLTRGRKPSGGRGIPHGVIREKPSADAPSAGGGTVNRSTEKVRRKTPPA
ncbi:hypothetical protein K0B96_05685 [Horticoccus luteus]|uniref:Uncharacterized protein n=1 Tax=Horticoccus luteus TaxID=2862869 RepID=A0A8F9XHC0_9BACT|nr:hypothetical protein [Horticoccus luteus]QYM80107.1 hypothetical protein K0B96_05685 [Horticoccus luteus]